jgi:hypothetical protein
VDEERPGRPALPAELTQQIRGFMDDHPEMAHWSLSDFVRVASQRYLLRLRRDQFYRLVLQQAKQGQVSEELDDALRLPDDLD